LGPLLFEPQGAEEIVGVGGGGGGGGICGGGGGGASCGTADSVASSCRILMPHLIRINATRSSSMAHEARIVAIYVW